MEEKKHQQLTKKVRFDLNEEVFLIPSKWDRLSGKSKTTNAKVIEGFTPRQRSRTVVERRSKSKHNGYKKIPNFCSVPSGKLFSTSESNETSSDNSVNSRSNASSNKSGNSPRKSSRQKTEGCETTTNNRNSISPNEMKLKFYHRTPQELPRIDLVLPKIPYTPDLKRAIEKALQRSRSRPTLENGLNSTTTLTQERKSDDLSSSPPEKGEMVLQRRLSDSSIRIGEPGNSTTCKPTNGEESSKFSDLSLDDWSPFSAWSAKDGSMRPTDQTPPITRGRSMSSLIPSSILY